MQVVTIFGSNLGNKHQIIQDAVQVLSTVVGELSATSSFYETEPWGFECEDQFLNQVVVFESSLSPQQFLQACLDTEKQLGRKRKKQTQPYTSRPIDIDVLFYDSLILDSPELTLPHPRICERNFVLTPLVEVLPSFVHPVYQQTITELLAICPDQLQAKQIIF